MNNKKNTNIVIAILAFILCVAALFLIIPQLQCAVDTSVGSDEDSLELQESKRIIQQNLITERQNFNDDVSLGLATDNNGEQFYKGKMSCTLERSLPELVEAYNADPSVGSIVNLEEIKYELTEGISGAFGEYNESTLKQFLNWCGQNKLVYRVDVALDENTAYRVGESVPAKTLSNYGYIVDKDLGIYEQYKFPWE